MLSLTVEAYARMMRALLPPGRAWRGDWDGIIAGALLGAAEELVRVGARAQALLTESDPRDADELLPEYEADLALASTGTIDERRARVVAHLLRRQRVRPADYQKALAPLLGQAPGDVVVIERSRADAIAVGDDREIYRFLIYRDPDLPGSYDIESAQALVDKMAHSHTKGHVIESIDMLCDDPLSLCDRDLLGV